VADLSRLFSPQSIAVIGGSWALNVIQQLTAIGFDGKIFTVHPYKQSLGGIKCYQNVADLPVAPDVSFIGVNRQATADILAQLRMIGAGGAVCFASGFSEASCEDESAATFEDRLVEAADGMPFIGPNCYGFVNYMDKVALWPDQHGGMAIERGVGIITQSSNMAINISMQKRSCPIGFIGTAGNQRSISQASMATHLIADDRITALGLHVEGITDLDSWSELARLSYQLKKPVIILKVGKSDEARQASLSHTASLAGSMAGATALMARFGMAMADDISSFLEALKLAHFTGNIDAPTISSLSCSGGEASLIADIAKHYGLSFPPLTDTQHTTLRDVLGPLVHLANPLDYQTYIWGQTENMTDVFAASLSGTQALGCLILDMPRSDRCDDASWKVAEQAFITASNRTGRKACVISSLPELIDEKQAKPFIEAGIPILCGFVEAIKAIRMMADIDILWRKFDPDIPHLRPRKDNDNSPESNQFLDEAETKALMEQAGIRCPLRIQANDMQTALLGAEKIGYPVVLKSRALAHKTEAGGVALNLGCARDVEDAFQTMPHQHGVMVEEMVEAGLAELLIGITHDPAHGFLLTIGQGGIFTELSQDTAHLVLPVTQDEILSGLKRLRIWPLLAGYRGKSGADIQAIIDTVLTVCELAYSYQNSLIELEINPLIAQSDGCVAADGLMRLSNGEAP